MFVSIDILADKRLITSAGLAINGPLRALLAIARYDFACDTTGPFPTLASLALASDKPNSGRKPGERECEGVSWFRKKLVRAALFIFLTAEVEMNLQDEIIAWEQDVDVALKRMNLIEPATDALTNLLHPLITDSIRFVLLALYFCF